MNAYLSVFRMRLLNGLQYRTAALAGMTTQFFFGFIFIMVFEAFYSNSTQAMPISFTQLVTYVWLQQAFLWFILLWFGDNEIISQITGGNIAYELCRPIELYGFWFAKITAQRLAGALLRSSPILIVGFILPQPYKMSLPVNITAFILFIVTISLGLLVLVAVSMYMYIFIFKTMSHVGPMIMIALAGEFLGGMIIPVPLMPDWLKTIVYCLPFRLVSDLPFRVYSGNIAPNDALISVLIQLGWLSFLVFTGRKVLDKILKNIIVQGG